MVDNGSTETAKARDSDRKRIVTKKNRSKMQREKSVGAGLVLFFESSGAWCYARLHFRSILAGPSPAMFGIASIINEKEAKGLL